MKFLALNKCEGITFFHIFKKLQYTVIYIFLISDHCICFYVKLGAAK